MEQRRIYKCWHCKRKYSLLREFGEQLQFTVICPFCYKEGMVDLKHYLDDPARELKSSPVDPTFNHCRLNLPEVILTAQSAEQKQEGI